MAGRPGKDRETMRLAAMMAASQVVEREGGSALTARRIAGEVGCSVGTLYNLFADLDDLILRVNGETLAQLVTALSGELFPGTPQQVLPGMVKAYLRFTRDNRHRWDLLFSHRHPPGKEPPAWYREQVAGALALLEGVIAPLLPEGEERRMAARVLWAGLHGICSLAGAGKLEVVSDRPMEEMAESLVKYYLSGLAAEATGLRENQS